MGYNNGFSQALEHAREVGHAYGPYSFSRLDGDCDFKFFKQYIDKSQGTQLTRFGTDEGTIMHTMSEIDVQMRLTEDPEHWASVEDIVGGNPVHLTERLELFRFSFKVNKDRYAGSEIHLGADIDMNSTDYDDKKKSWFRGKIDYLELDNLRGIARVVDYKNYPKIHTDAEIDQTSFGVGAQQMGYLALVMANYPHIKAGWYEIYYFRFGTSRRCSIMVTRDQVERWWRLNQQKMIAVERKQEFKPTPSQYACQYCRFMDHCHWYQEFGEKELIISNKDDAQDLVKRLTVLKEEEKRIKSVLDIHAKEHGPVKIQGGPTYGYMQVDDRKVDVVKFFEICHDKGIDPKEYVSVPASKALTAGAEESIVTRVATRKVFK